MITHKQIAQRAGVVGSLTLLSRVAGLFRDIAIAHTFGTRLAADAFFVAFRIPNLLRRLFAEGALTVSFVPIFTQSLRKSENEAKRVADVSFTLLLAILIIVAVLGVLAAPWLVRLTAWGFSRDPEKFELTVSLTRVMFPYILLVSLAAWAMGVLNSLKHFAAPAASSIFMNLGVITGALVIASLIDPPVLGLALGVLLGGLLQFAIHIPVLRRHRYLPRFRWDPSHPAVKKILGMMIPAAYGAAVYQFNVITITLLASFLSSGSVSYLWYADRIMEFPLGIFAVSLATVILPTLADHAADHDHQKLKETFSFGLRLIFFVTLPATGGLIVLSNEIIRVLFQHGIFGELSTAATASALVCFALGLPFISGVRITSNAFYSLQDSKTPVRIANWAVLVNLALSLILMFPLKHNGLALAVSLSSLFNFLMQIVDFRKKVGRLGLRKIAIGGVKSVLATLFMVCAVWVVKNRFPIVSGELLGNSFRLLGIILLGVIVYLAFGFLLRMDEPRAMIDLMRKRRRETATPPPPIDPLAGV